MRAVVLAEFGDPDVLTLAERPLPEPGAGEVRVAVRASFVAFGRDASVRSGKHPKLSREVTLPHVLGGEHAGVVDAVGTGVSDELLGLRVAVSATVPCAVCEPCKEERPWDCLSVTAVGIHRQGSNAEYTVVPAGNLSELPPGLSFGHAAAFAASGPLAWEELGIGRAGPGDWVFVPGATGSVGMLLVALAKRRGASVVAASRGRRAPGVLASLGADAVVDSAAPDLADQLRGFSSRGMDVVVDNVADTGLWRRYWPAVARRGRIIVAGQAGNRGEPLPIDVVAFYNRRATLTGLTIGDPRPVAEFWAALREQPLDIPAGLLHVFPLERAADAHRLIESGVKVGHVVLSLP